jgi:copper chaperone CopZ
MKIALLLAAFFLAAPCSTLAQIAGLKLGVNGLTCSQCTRNVEMQLRKLSFVADVHMNLEHTDGFMKLKDGARMEPERVVKAVKDAGFSVRFLDILFAHPAKYDWTTGCVKISDLNFQIVGNMPAVLPDTLSLQLLGEPFQPRKAAAPLPQKRCPDTQFYITPSPDGAS